MINEQSDKGQGLQAFSLPEMLVVLVIIGILVLIALPNLMPLISKAKAMEAQQQLAFVHISGDLSVEFRGGDDRKQLYR